MSMYKETRGPNWGAALAAIGGGFSDYAETKRREMAMKMLREQQVADRELARSQSLEDLAAAQSRQDLLNTQQSGPILPSYQKPANAFSGLDANAAIGYASGLQFPEPAPQTPVQYYGGLQMPSEIVGGMRAKPAVGLWKDLNPTPQQRQTDTLLDFTYPSTADESVRGQTVQVPPSTYGSLAGNFYVPPKPTTERETKAFTYPDWVPEIGGTTVYVPDAQYASLSNRFYGPRGSGAGGGGTSAVPKPLDVERRADSLVEGALGPAVEKTTAKGEVYDFSMGGTEGRSRDLQNFVPPEMRRAFWQASYDSSAATDPNGMPRWPIDAPSDVLAGKIWDTVAPQYAEVQIPGDWVFDGGQPGTTEDDRFVLEDGGIGKFDKKKRPIDFFKDHIVPIVNNAEDPKLGWQAFVASAGKYGLDPNELIPLLNKDKFAFLLGAANASATEDKIKSIFGDK